MSTAPALPFASKPVELTLTRVVVWAMANWA